MIYLFETGLCLSLLYLAYWLFLRRETYFNFNRIYLVGSIVLTLAVPLLHLNFFIPDGSSLQDPAMGIIKFRNYYAEMIELIDADFGTEPGARHDILHRGLSEPGYGEGRIIPSSEAHGLEKKPGGIESGKSTDSRSRGVSFSGFLFIIYIGGVIYFLARFVYLVIRLYLLARKNRVVRQEGFRLVEIEEDIAPFSFFRFLFINNSAVDESDLYHVLEHEKAHIRQKHSMDHLFAHGLAVFQWFNPMAWQIRNALKTNHEYIADRHVINRGIELYDYQSLLLKQVVGYHSAELVNNFNLKPIKKRIAMMNKTRSGIPAKFKAMLVIPIALFVFFLFADFTLRDTGSGPVMPGPVPEGLWLKQSQDDFSRTLFIHDNLFAYTEGTEIRDFFLKAEGDFLVLSRSEGGNGVRLKYELDANEMILWWSDSRASRYTKSVAENTLDDFLESHHIELDLPYISQYRLLDEEKIYRLCCGMDDEGGTSLTFNGFPFKLDDLDELVNKEKSKLNKIDQGSLTALFLIDRSIPMDRVDQIRKELRKMNALHIAEGGYPQGDIKLSPMLFHAVALPRLLPPVGAKVLDKKTLKKQGGSIYTINLADRNTTPRDVDEGLQRFMAGDHQGKYVISLEFDGAIPYGHYVEVVDMIFNVVYRFRNERSLEKYRIPYDQLGAELQREMRKAYPMALSESMITN